jgi:FHS family L-fucose permease-like MFS transporter
MVVPVCFFVIAWSYAVCVNFVPAYRDPADKTQDASISIKKDEETGYSGEMKEEEKLDDDITLHDPEKPEKIRL